MFSDQDDLEEWCGPTMEKKDNPGGKRKETKLQMSNLEKKLIPTEKIKKETIPTEKIPSEIPPMKDSNREAIKAEPGTSQESAVGDFEGLRATVMRSREAISLLKKT